MSVALGSSFTLAVQTQGFANFQWIRDGMPVLHETCPSLHIPVVGRHHIGAYVVRISSPQTGQVLLSDVAQVSLNTPKQTRLHMVFPEEGPWAVGWDFAKVDIVFVHDLWGDYKQSWTNAKGEFWPVDFIRQQYPYARTLSYDYPAQPSFWLDGAETLDLQQRSKNMLDCLLGKDVGSRPIVFVGHGMGGILVKVLLVYASNQIVAGDRAHRILLSTVGTVFYSSPHLGTGAVDFTPALAALLRLSPTTVALKPLAERLLEVHDAFGRLCARRGIQSRRFSAAAELGGRQAVVPDWSADPRMPSNEHTALSTSHAAIAKPDDWDDERYSHFTNFLSGILAERGIGLDCPWSPHFQG